MHHWLMAYRGCFALLGFQARRNLLSLGKTWKLILVSFLFFALLLQPKATQCGFLTAGSNHASSARSALRAIQDGGRGNFKWAMGLIFGRQLKKCISQGGVFFLFQIF